MKSRGQSMGIGSLSMMMVFVTLCLTVFATLALLTVHRDYKLTEKTLTSFEDYYEAEGKAQVLLAEIDSILIKEIDHPQMLKEQLSGIDEIQEVEDLQDAWMVTYEVPFGSNQKIVVKLQVDQQPARGERYKIKEWIVAIEEVWQYEENEPSFEDIIID